MLDGMGKIVATLFNDLRHEGEDVLAADLLDQDRVERRNQEPLTDEDFQAILEPRKSAE